MTSTAGTRDQHRSAARSRRPRPDEMAPYHAAYIAEVPTGDIVDVLRTQLGEMLALARSLPARDHTFRYEPGRWSIAELFGHITDIERAYGLRAMCFARKDPGPLPDCDEGLYVATADFDARGLASILEEYEHVRLANIALYASLDEAALERRGTASGRELSVRTMMYLTAGHAAHHIGVLREHYLRKLAR